MQIIVVARNIIVLQLFISRMPKMCAIPQLVSAPLKPIPTVEHFRRSHPQCEHSYGQQNFNLEIFWIATKKPGKFARENRYLKFVH